MYIFDKYTRIEVKGCIKNKKLNILNARIWKRERNEMQEFMIYSELMTVL